MIFNCNKIFCLIQRPGPLSIRIYYTVIHVIYGILLHYLAPFIERLGMSLKEEIPLIFLLITKTPCDIDAYILIYLTKVFLNYV